MLIVQNVIVPQEFQNDLYFCCDLAKCKGACCIAGDAGAPLKLSEINSLIEHLNLIRPFMQKQAAEIISPENLFDYDQEGNPVTALLNNRECVFTNFKAGIAYCSIEKAFSLKQIPIRKPVSCFLYPIRVQKEGAFEKIIYHRWDICRPAVEYGTNRKITLVDFLQKPLKENFGREWYSLFHNALKNNGKLPPTLAED
jgi:hypothetical protein